MQQHEQKSDSQQSKRKKDEEEEDEDDMFGIKNNKKVAGDRPTASSNQTTHKQAGFLPKNFSNKEEEKLEEPINLDKFHSKTSVMKGEEGDKQLP